MALDIQTIAATPSYVPYERPPQPFTLWSAIPRGLQSFIVDTQELDIKAAVDDALLNITATLPPNFGYVFADAHITIAQDRALDWDDRCNLNLQNFYRAPVNISVGLVANYSQGFLVSALDGVERSLVHDNDWPAYPMIASEGTSGILSVLSINNPSNNLSALGTVNALLLWWQFDLEQIRKYPINSPIPTHAR